MAKLFGYERGLAKYIVKTPLTVTGFVSMYLFGGGILSVANSLEYLFREGSMIGAIFTYYFSEYLPPTSLSQVLYQTLVGTVVAGLLWYYKTAL